MTEKERNLLYGVVSLILPENILDQFVIVKLEDEDIARNDGTYQPFKHNVHIYLDEQDNRTADQRASLKANGFTEYTSVKDYPVRNRLLTLHIRRRRYLDAEDRSVILSEFPLKADGTSISPEFADFHLTDRHHRLPIAIIHLCSVVHRKMGLYASRLYLSLQIGYFRQYIIIEDRSFILPIIVR